MQYMSRYLARLKTRLLQKRLIVKSLSISFISQAVSSLTNFCIVLYLVRVLDKIQFGQYSFGFALILFISGLICAFIGVQFVVNLPDQPLESRATYTLHHLVLIIMGGFIILCLAFISKIIIKTTFSDLSVLKLIFPIAVASVLYALHDLLMRFAFSERREGLVFGSNVVVAVTITALFLAISVTGHSINASSALYTYAIGQAAGSIQAIIIFNLPWCDVNLPKIIQAFYDSWAGGRWHILTTLVYSLRAQTHNFVIAPILGFAALAEVNAARLLLTPAIMAIPPSTQVIMPRLAEQRVKGNKKLFQTSMIWIVTLFSIAIIYSMLLLFLSPWVVPLALGKEYSHVGPLILIWCFAIMFFAFRNGVSVALLVIRSFRQLFYANIVATILTVVFAITLSRIFGAGGAVFAFAFSEFLLSIILFVLLRTQLANEKQHRTR